MSQHWDIWIDTGGTFTDCLTRDPQGHTQRIKVLSSSRLRGHITGNLSANRFSFSQHWPVEASIFTGYQLRLPAYPDWQPARVVAMDVDKGQLKIDRNAMIPAGADFELTAGEEAPILAARLATRTPLGASLPPLRMRLGSTRGTNALLERKGAPVCLLITRGFRDLPYIGSQERPELFQLDIPEPDQLYQDVIEVEERLSAEGEVLTPLTSGHIDELVQQVQAGGYQSVAVCLLHAYRHPQHERALREALAEVGVKHISVSHELSPTIKLLPRTRTALVNAYLAPVIHEYLDQIARIIGVHDERSELLVMSSAGGLVPYLSYRPKDSLLSGPAGGMVGAATIGHQMGHTRLLTLDMGGTSTDTARYDEVYDYQFTTQIDGITMQSPALAIETVAAGGGSICFFDGQKLCVGPESAGADPGPACYGAGGPLTITDVNLLLGKLKPEKMGIPIHRQRAEDALHQLQQEVERQTGQTYPQRELLLGLEKIANEKMADAIRRISVARGFDPADYTLLAFGGAGGMHAAQVAELLDIQQLILPYDGGLLSAYGIGHASVERIAEEQVLQPLDAPNLYLADRMQALRQKAQGLLATEGFAPDHIHVRQLILFLRFQGQDSPLEIDCTNPHQDPLQAFRQRYEQLFGYFPDNRTVEVESMRCIAATRTTWPPPGTIVAQQVAHAETSTGPYPVFNWQNLMPGDYLTGPALLLNPTSTAFLPQGWTVTCGPDRNLLATAEKTTPSGTESVKEAIALELFTNRFSAIAEEMGAQLQRTAFSVNVKERLDFSCALLDADARLLVNAPHIPVHLGSLGICARLVLQHTPLEPGDVLLTNHPKYGGSHLPDVTMLSGVYTDAGELIGYVINRAHHAEIGGKRPGSMPPDARNLAEEGVAITPTYLVRRGQPQWAQVRRLFQDARYPSRSLEENMADIKAALASLRSGQRALRALVAKHGLEKVHYYMQRLQDLAADTLEESLGQYRNKTCTATESLDDGHTIQVTIDFSTTPYRFDFTGTSAAHPYNLNANVSIVYSAVLYVLRLLCGTSIPLNEGLMRQVDLGIPTSFLHPDFVDKAENCPAVVGGNTEVSQRLVDTLLKALELAACSQGTMNNLLFGDERFGYYETIGGGVGAGEGFHGRSAVHQHMTNTRLTDPEELEFRYPVRVHEFAIRRGSGGDGQWRGGDGIVREIEFLCAVDFTLLSQHRVVAPYGLHGGQPGRLGQQWLIHGDGSREALQGIDHRTLQARDRIRLETPGGGGWGS